MNEKLTWDDMQEDLRRYFNNCSDDEFVHYYNEICSTRVKVEDIE